jgi:hypothetical protein
LSLATVGPPQAVRLVAVAATTIAIMMAAPRRA